MINEQIRDKEIRLIGSDGEQLGIMSSREALKKAEKRAIHDENGMERVLYSFVDCWYLWYLSDGG